jgi:hypothetical protein
MEVGALSLRDQIRTVLEGEGAGLFDEFGQRFQELRGKAYY